MKCTLDVHVVIATIMQIINVILKLFSYLVRVTTRF